MTLQFSVTLNDDASIFHLSLITDNHIPVKVFFKNGDVWTIDVDQMEFDPLDDTLYGVYIKAGGAFYSLADVKIHAARQHDGLLDEALDDLSSESAITQELSSPYLTGRV